MNSYIKKFEQVMTVLLAAIMALAVTLAAGDLVWLLIRDVITPPLLLLDTDEVLDVFGAFLLVLIGIELLETLKEYVREREVRAEVVILVALIALGRKVITLDVKATSGLVLLGLAAVLVALGLTYYLLHGLRRQAPLDRSTEKT